MNASWVYVNMKGRGVYLQMKCMFLLLPCSSTVVLKIVDRGLGKTLQVRPKCISMDTPLTGLQTIALVWTLLSL